ncbi:ImmA/IrrE family metallo-endopeptidase [Pseudomonas sp. UBA6310]|uniref:ImmA/IrrE family metallo-endopeptidase n=1 Tax=Pseudomonas sp. UBA6310 TaxID=1947327 RepID=UPI00257EB951|nr:ImmA/IrrE family metallo-endopeptidase [Pseudomonas sp. UBA6310]
MAFIRKNSSKPGGSIKNLEQSTPDDRNLSVEQLRDFAHRQGIETNPLDVHGLTAALGIEFVCIPMSDEISGALSLIEGSTRWLMKVNALHHPNRQRFTIAHELAHYSRHRFTHKSFVDQNFFRNGETSSMEIEANRFAGELLMPESDFRHFVSIFGGNIEALSQHFRVSTLAVRVRAKTLGMKGHGL